MIVIVPLIRFVMGHTLYVWMNHMTLFERADALMWGCLFAIYQERILAFLRRHKYIVYLSAVAIAFSMTTPSLTGKLSVDWPYRISSCLFGAHGTVPNIAIAFIMLGSVYSPANLWFKLLNTTVFDYIGKLSYSIYLWQQFFILGMAGIVTRVPYSFICLPLAALASYYLIEQPFLKLKKRFETVHIERSKKPSGKTETVTVLTEQNSPHS